MQAPSCKARFLPDSARPDSVVSRSLHLLLDGIHVAFMFQLRAPRDTQARSLQLSDIRRQDCSAGGKVAGNSVRPGAERTSIRRPLCASVIQRMMARPSRAPIVRMAASRDAEHRLEPSGQAVDDRSERPQLVTRIVHREALVETMLADFIGSAHHRGQRNQIAHSGNRSRFVTSPAAPTSTHLPQDLWADE